MSYSLVNRQPKLTIDHFSDPVFDTSVFLSVYPALQTLTPHNKGLFKRAISQSGVALCPWAINENPRKFAEEVRLGLFSRLSLL